MNKTVEQEAQDASNGVYGTSRKFFVSKRDGFIRGYIAGSAARSNEAKDFAEWLAKHTIMSASITMPWLYRGELYTTEQLLNIYKSNP